MVDTEGLSDGALDVVRAALIKSEDAAEGHDLSSHPDGEAVVFVAISVAEVVCEDFVTSVVLGIVDALKFLKLAVAEPR